jgi:hypothetical protein
MFNADFTVGIYCDVILVDKIEVVATPRPHKKTIADPSKRVRETIRYVVLLPLGHAATVISISSCLSNGLLDLRLIVSLGMYLVANSSDMDHPVDSIVYYHPFTLPAKCTWIEEWLVDPG